MARLNPNEILRQVEAEGFERVWKRSAELLPKPSGRRERRIGRGESHPLYDLIQRLRELFLEMGFTEVSNPIIIDENEVYKQYGPEAPIILDRCYYLATLPRPDIGLSKAKRREIEKLGVKLTDKRVTAIRRTLRSYKRGEIEPDDLIEALSKALGIPDTTAMLIVSRVFPEFASLRPEPTTQTLRSHMTTPWFLTLQALQYKVDLPLRLFSIGVRFRREQREDPTHLRVHHSASCVVMDEEVDVEEGEEITRNLLEPLGFERFRFVRKDVTSKYYAPGMEYEGYIYHPTMDRWIEVVNYGLYSPIALARYGIEYPVLNVGVGVERVALALYREDDVRRLVYPQFYAELTLSDEEIARMVRIEVEPETPEGSMIKRRIIEEAIRNADKVGPCELLVYDGEVMGRKVRVYLYERDEGAKLIGAAAMNKIYIYKGNVLGIPEDGMEDLELVREARRRGVQTGIRFIDGVASLAARRIEEAVRSGKRRINVRVRIAKRPRDVNIEIGEVARRYITSRKGRIEVSGPVFMGVRAEIESLNPRS
ncbi:O-phosphoserine--tRNA ligase [Candidatus Bathyarchaeota archaeon]|nr:MAG: O-phosphoserine--tRNA ligase [Candidatus Bathyarchaeota archaeon]